MKLECLMLWAERFLFTGQDGTEKGLIGWLKGSFTEDDRIVFTEMSGEADNRFRNEWEELCIFLSGEHGVYERTDRKERRRTLCRSQWCYLPQSRIR